MKTDKKNPKCFHFIKFIHIFFCMLMIRPRVVKKITNHLDPAAEIKKDPDPFVYIYKNKII